MVEGAQESQKEAPSSPLQIDPKCVQDALRGLLQPAKSDDPRLDFYTMYQKEATEYDKDRIKRHHEDLNATLIFAGLFTAVSSSFVIYIQSKFGPDPNERSEALLRAILLTLNQSAATDETLTAPSDQEHPSVLAAATVYMSLLLSLFAAFAAMWGKRWLGSDLRNAGRTMIEHCGDRQRKCDEFKKWRFELYIEAPAIMLYIAIFLLVIGVYVDLGPVNTTLTIALFPMIPLGALFILISFLGTLRRSRYPAVPSSGKKPGSRITAALRSIAAAGTSSYGRLSWSPVLAFLRGLWAGVAPLPLRILRTVVRLPRVVTQHRSRSPPLPITGHTPPQALPTTTTPDTPTIPGTSPWLEHETRTTLCRENASDIRCTSWVLWNMVNQEVLDLAIRLASTIRWFEGGLNILPPYDLIVSTLIACFDPSGKLHPGSRDRAYYSAQAVLWIHIRAERISAELATRFSLPIINYNTSSLFPDRELQDLLETCRLQDTPLVLARMYSIPPGVSLTHLRWRSNALLHLSWAMQEVPDAFGMIDDHVVEGCMDAVPLDAMLNRLLTSCIFLGGAVERDVLKIQDKSGHSERIASEISQAILSAIRTSHTRLSLLPHILRDVAKWDDRPRCFAAMGYEWCSVMWENHQNPTDDVDDQLLLSLEIGFRNLDPGSPLTDVKLVHTEHHQRLADVVFERADDEVIADLLHAWTSTSDSHGPPTWFETCARHFIELRSPSPRLRRFIIRSVGLIGYNGFEQVGVAGFARLLDDLGVGVEDIDARADWTLLLLDIAQSSQGTQHLSLLYWELLAELVILDSPLVQGRPYAPQTVTSLRDAQEWDKLECWIGVVWILWPPGAGGAAEGDLEHVMVTLSRQRPDAISKLEQRVKRWSGEHSGDLSESFRGICKLAREALQQDAL